MSVSLDISVHGPQRVAIIEQLVHICRYTPGLVLLEGDSGKSPVNFLRHMADLLRDELDFALLEAVHVDVSRIAAGLVSQWFIYKEDLEENTDVQSVHHYLDISLQSGRLALIVVERSSLLTEDATNYLVSMMARHSRLTVLVTGIVDARPLLRRAQQTEVPIHRIDLPDPVDAKSLYQQDIQFGRDIQGNSLESDALQNKADRGLAGLDHSFSDESYDLPDEEDEFAEDDFIFAQYGDKNEPEVNTRIPNLQVSKDDTGLMGMTAKFIATREWGAEAVRSVRQTISGSVALVLGCIFLAALLYLMIANKVKNDIKPVGFSDAESVSMAKPDQDAYLSSVSVGKSIPSSALVVDAALAPTPVVSEPVIALPEPVGGGEVPAASLAIVQAVEKRPAEPSEQHIAMHNQDLDKPKIKPTAPKVIPVVSTNIPAAKAQVATEKQWSSKPSNFTIQIAAAHGESNIRLMQGKLPSSQTNLLYRTTRDGKPWFVLVYGSFPNKRAAMAALKTLSPEIKMGTTPWIRQQGEIFTR